MLGKGQARPICRRFHRLPERFRMRSGQEWSMPSRHKELVGV